MPHNAICRLSGKPFVITDRDLEFYAKIGVPPPTLCPEERMRRRFTFRNERNIYPDTCDMCGSSILSLYSPEKPFTVYCQECWWSDKWNPREFGKSYDPSQSFMAQYQALMADVPRIALLNLNNENSKYCNFTGDVKNSYLIFGSVYSEDCYYGSPYYSKDCVDTLVVRDCELCYECTDCRKCYKCRFCQDCTNSSELLFSYDLQNCRECIACSGLRDKEYCIANQPYSKEEYEKFKSQINLCNPAALARLQEMLDEQKVKTPRKFMQSRQAENISGDHVYNSKNTLNSFFADRCEDCSYCAQVVDMKDCYDCNYTEEDELCYEYLGMYATKNTSFSLFCRHTYAVWYSEYCVNVKNAFGCIGLKNAEYCILNKAYEQSEYEKLRAQIIENMKKTGKYGEFFPSSISPFGYNETVAQEYFPLEENEAAERRYGWKEKDLREYQKQTAALNADIKQVPESITQEILACTLCEKNYRIIAQELAFYKREGLPIPARCPNCRHSARIALRNPRTLFERSCGKCGASIQTTYAPERPEKVYCEGCYLREVY